MNEQELAEFISKLPEHLRFFFAEPPANMAEEEFLQFARELIAMARLHRDELIAHGVRADRFLADMVPKLQGLEEACVAADKAQDDFLTVTANMADAEYELFKQNEKMVKAMEEQRPFDPSVQELRERLDEAARNFPKE